MKRLGEMSKEERSQLTQEQLDEVLQQDGAGTAFLSQGALHVTLDDLKACEPYFEAASPRSGSLEGILMHAVSHDAL